MKSLTSQSNAMAAPFEGVVVVVVVVVVVMGVVEVFSQSKQVFSISWPMSMSVTAWLYLGTNIRPTRTHLLSFLSNFSS